MRLRSTLLALGLTAAVVVAANAVVKRAASHSIPRQVLREIDSAPQEIDVLAVGNSLMRSGFDAANLERYFLARRQHMTAVNAGLGSSNAIEHLVLADRALRGHRVGTIVYGFFDQQLAFDLPRKNSDLIGNQSMMYYDEPAVTLEYAPFQPVDRLAFQVYRCCSLLMERGAIWAKVEKLRRSMSGVGMPRQQTNQFGRVSDFGLLEARTTDDFVQSCRTIIRSDALLSAPVIALLEHARARGAAAIVVAMPMPHLHVTRFYDQSIWREYLAKTRIAVERHGATFLDASRDIPDDRLFQDNLHLAASGAAQFSGLLAAYLSQHEADNRSVRDSKKSARLTNFTGKTQ